MKQVEIKKEDLIYNIQALKKLCAPARIIAVLKGNGYGLDLCQFAQVLLEQGVDFFAVSELSEAVQLRMGGFENEILLLTPTNSPDDARVICDMGITATVGSLRHAEALEAVGLPVNAHLKIDTGFGRFGFYTHELTDALKRFEHLRYTGVFSHLSDSFGKKEAHTKRQYEQFLQAIAKLQALGIDPPLRHLCNSCGAVRFAYARMGGVRIGSAFLGRLPVADPVGLKRIARLTCPVSEVRTLPKGSNVGYANTYTARRETKAAIIPVGYKDGYGVEKSADTFRPLDVLRYMYRDLRKTGSRIYVSIGGRRYPLIGRISMHNIIADVTGSDVQPGDTAVMECNPILIKDGIQRNYI